MIRVILIAIVTSVYSPVDLPCAQRVRRTRVTQTTTTVVRTDAREWSDEQLADLFSDGFPAFITADKLARQYVGRVREWFPEWNLILVDAQQDPVATGWGIPVRWDGTVAGLPTGYTDATIRAVAGREQG